VNLREHLVMLAITRELGVDACPVAVNIHQDPENNDEHDQEAVFPQRGSANEATEKTWAGPDGHLPGCSKKQTEKLLNYADKETMDQCLKCKSGNVIPGKLGNPTRYSSFALARFKPDRKLRFLALTFSRGTRCNEEAFACLDCGLVWASLPAEELKDFITTCCKKPEPDPNEQSPAYSVNNHPESSTPPTDS
jgi:hypothetical protein